MLKYLTLAIFALVILVNTHGHSGRTDKNGGHNCNLESIQKGLCTGYHFHNGRVYLDENEELVEIASLDGEKYFYNFDADEHELNDDHIHYQETIKIEEDTDKPTGN